MFMAMTHQGGLLVVAIAFFEKNIDFYHGLLS